MSAQPVAVDLGPVQETLLIPLLGRAAETRRASGLIQDPKAVEIVEALDYDFSKWERTLSLAGATLRTRLFDEEVQAFLDAHPEGTVVEVGAGLNTRYERLDNGRARWFELDLPDSMALRRRFFADEERRTMIAASALDTDWYDAVAATGGPWCFVSEAVLIYLDGPDVQGMMQRLSARFPGARYVTDTMCAAMVDSPQARHDVMKHLSKESWFRWRCDDPAALTGWGLRLLRSRSFLDASPALLSRMPSPMSLICRWAPWLIRGRIDGYRVNVFELTGSY